MIKTTIMGYGTIGFDVTEILDKNRDVIVGQVEREVESKYVLDLRKLRNSPVADKIVHDFKMIRRDEEVKIVVETMGGLNPACPFMKACLMAGKHVITSNKAPVAAHGTELLATARGKNVNFFFKASVGGGIPIIRSLYRCLMGERIEEITDVLNGTASFILAKMGKKGEPFENTLKGAQNLGYAERSPGVDVEGHDICREIAILTAMVIGKEAGYEDICTGGITWITDIGFKCMERMGISMKLFGTSRIGDGGVLTYVAPAMINETSPLYSMNDTFSDVLVKGNMLGTFMFYGSGAGKLPIGSAVVADIVEAAQNLKRNIPMDWTGEKQIIEPMDQTQFRYLVRVAGSYCNKEQNVKSAFGQMGVIELCGMDEFALLAAQMTEREFKRGAVSYDTRERERSEYGVKQMMRAVL